MLRKKVPFCPASEMSHYPSANGDHADLKELMRMVWGDGSVHLIIICYYKTVKRTVW